MSDSTLSPHLLSVGELFSEGPTYRIPMYQRNYAWGMAEIQQLVSDIHDGQHRSPEQPYYIGTLVVDCHTDPNGLVSFEVIDGQQRLTTLMLLGACLRKKLGEPFDGGRAALLRFDCREAANKKLDALWGVADSNTAASDVDAISQALQHGYDLIVQALMPVANGQEAFTNYLLSKVYLLRVSVPPNTDLSQYFEVMNNRGEQLEKHEVLKARLMGHLEPGRRQDVFARIWDACADMSGYVHRAFTAEREKLLTDKAELMPQDFSALMAQLELTAGANTATNRVNTDTLDAILQAPMLLGPNSDRDASEPGRYHSVINFPNFLLQVLNVQQAKSNPVAESLPTGSLPELNDKRLLEIFDTWLLKHVADQEKCEAIEAFAWMLLSCRMLLDQYVIKRDSLEDNFSLRRYFWRTSGADQVNTFDVPDLNKRLLMLQAAFHVSAPTHTYKYWLNAALTWLASQRGPIDGTAYLMQLESVAQAFMFDRYLKTPDQKANYAQIIHGNKGRCQNLPTDGSETTTALSYGSIDNILVFNWLDYLLWCDCGNRADTNPLKDFRFTFRSSIEHMHPQTPIDGKTWSEKDVHDFGNLCLIDSSMNSSLSNLGPLAKRERYKDAIKSGVRSVKQCLMFDLIEQHGWTNEVMRKHGKEMLDVLLQYRGYPPELHQPL